MHYYCPRKTHEQQTGKSPVPHKSINLGLIRENVT